MDPFAARSFCHVAQIGMAKPKWDNTSNYNSPSLNQEPGNYLITLVKVRPY